MDIVIFRKKAGGRLKQFIIEQQISKSEFAESIDVPLSTLSKVIAKGGGISSGMIYKILNTYPQLSWDWIFNGVGNMFNEKQVENKPIDILYNGLGSDINAIENLHKIIEEKDKRIADLQKILSEVQNDKKRLYQDKERLWELLEQKKG